MKATRKYGDLEAIPDCTLSIPVTPEGGGAATPTDIEFYILPDISDSKGASYNDENLIGRSNPIKTYSHSENRSISVEIHFIALKREHIERNLEWLRTIQSAVYPRDGSGGAPYLPPPICHFKCGQLLGQEGVCVILKNYSVKFPTDVPWATVQVGGITSLLPYKFDVSTTWEVVYASSKLPGQHRIVDEGS